MYQSLVDLLKGLTHQTVTLEERLKVDPYVGDCLKVTSWTVIKDAALPSTSPWKVCRKPNRDAAGEVTMSAEIRISPYLAEQTMSQGSPSDALMKQMMSVCWHVADESRLWATETSVDTTLPNSKPYRCVNQMSTGGNGVATSIVVGPDLAERLGEADKFSAGDLVNNFRTDIRVFAHYKLALRPSETAGAFDVYSPNSETPPYTVAKSVKRVIDVFMRTLPLFNEDVRRGDLGPATLLDRLLYNSISLHRISRTSSSDELPADPGAHFDALTKLDQEETTCQEQLSKAREATKRIFGSDMLDALLSAVDELQGQVGFPIAYVRDFSRIHGFRYGSYDERLEYLFESHELTKLVAAHNKGCEERHAQIYERGGKPTEPETFLFLRFFLSSTDMALPPQAEVVLSDPEDKFQSKEDNQRLVCVKLTPQAVQLLLNAKSPEDDSIKSIMDTINEATARLFKGRREPR
jgi:hypothetical protein